MKIFVGIFLAWLSLSEGWAAGPCNRTATIDYQEVSLETIPGLKGEGLRMYLEKDDEALRYLNIYQERNQIYPFNTLLGVAGPGLLLTGLILDSPSEQKSTFLTWGAVLMVTNFLVTKTLQGASESYLEKAIEEYNKRHSPRIDLNVHSPPATRKTFALGIKKNWSF